jgi:hypothetical protein
MKWLILFFATVLIVQSAEVNETKRSTDNVIQSNPQPLVDLHTLKNSTKDAAERIISLIRPSTEKPPETTQKHPLFGSLHNLNLFGFHKPSEAVKPTVIEPQCICNPPIAAPTIPTVSSYLPVTPTSSFLDQETPSFEVIYPPNKYFSSSIEAPISNHYPPLDLENLWKYAGSDNLPSTSFDNNNL